MTAITATQIQLTVPPPRIGIPPLPEGAFELPPIEIEVHVPEERAVRTCCYSLFRDPRGLSRKDIIRLACPLVLSVPITSGLSCIAALILNKEPRMGAIFGAVFGAAGEVCSLALTLCEPPPTATTARRLTHVAIGCLISVPNFMAVTALAHTVIKKIGYELAYYPDALQLGGVSVGLGVACTISLVITGIAFLILLGAANRAVAYLRARPEAV